MPTAPSFATYKRITEEPFIKNGKYYITVEHPTTKNHRDVRWYSDAEYAKAYGNKSKEKEDGFSGLKHTRGFDNGPILVIRNNKAADEEWLINSCARYSMGIGWYIASTDTVPADIPDHFKFLLLGWKEAIIDERHLKKPTELTTILAKKAKNNEWVVMKC